MRLLGVKMNNPFKQKRQVLSALKNIKDSGISLSCRQCGNKFPKEFLSNELFVCPNCGYHMGITAPYRIKTLVDEGSFKQLFAKVHYDNPLDFPDYSQKLLETQEKTKLSEGVVCGTAKIQSNKVCICVMDSRFLMGSMGSAVGERITRTVEYATKYKLPLIIFSASGGARMQEGILSLFQMAKTSAAVEKHNKAGGLFISVMTHPTTGGVTASFASLGDIIIAEPGALIGFAGPRVIKQTIGESLPEGFQTAEYLQQHGFVDMICNRKNMRDTLGKLLALHKGV